MKHKELSLDEKISWIRLIRTYGIGPRYFRSLMNVYGTASASLQYLSSWMEKKNKTLFSRTMAKKELEYVESRDGTMIAACESNYPQSLKIMHNAPPIITVLGNKDILHSNSIAIVGSRNATIHNKKLTYNISRDIGKNGMVTVSGLARGIDSQVHIASVDSNYPTIAVLAHGIDTVYPVENASLFDSILEHGAVITEFSYNTLPKSQFFPARNRIIASLSLATVIIEARMNSGSLITAKLAKEQKKDVFACPGSPLDHNSSGVNHLIKSGDAQLIESAEDIINGLSIAHNNMYEDMYEKNSNKYQQGSLCEGDTEKIKELILESMSIVAVGIDDIINDIPCHPDITIISLLELEMQDKIARNDNNQFYKSI